MTTQEARLAWLETLQPGDPVAVTNSKTGTRQYRLRQILSISRIKRWIQVSGYTMKFGRRGEAGDLSLVPITNEVRARIRRQRLVNEIRSFDLDRAPVEVLARIHEIQKTSGVGYKTPTSWVHE